jgi:hypothetical protein
VHLIIDKKHKISIINVYFEKESEEKLLRTGFDYFNTNGIREVLFDHQ